MGPKARPPAGPRKERMVRTTLLMPESVWRAAKTKALDVGEGSLAAVILHALDLYLSGKGGGHGR